MWVLGALAESLGGASDPMGDFEFRRVVVIACVSLQSRVRLAVFEARADRRGTLLVVPGRWTLSGEGRAAPSADLGGWHEDRR